MTLDDSGNTITERKQDDRGNKIREETGQDDRGCRTTSRKKTTV